MRPASPPGIQKREKLISGLYRLTVDLAAGEPEDIEPERPQGTIPLPITLEACSSSVSLESIALDYKPSIVSKRQPEEHVGPDCPASAK
jgi:hypothetical protein